MLPWIWATTYLLQFYPPTGKNSVTLLTLSSRQIPSEITRRQAPATRNHSFHSSLTHPEAGPPVGRMMPILGQTSPAASHPQSKSVKPIHKTIEEPKHLERNSTPKKRYSATAATSAQPNHTRKIISQQIKMRTRRKNWTPKTQMYCTCTHKNSRSEPNRSTPITCKSQSNNLMQKLSYIWPQILCFNEFLINSCTSFAPEESMQENRRPKINSSRQIDDTKMI